MLSRGRSRQVDQEFKAALDYILNVRLAGHLSINNPMPNKQTNKKMKSLSLWTKDLACHSQCFFLCFITVPKSKF